PQACKARALPAELIPQRDCGDGSSGVRADEVGLSKLIAKGWVIDLASRDCRSCLDDARTEVIQPQVPLRLPCYDFTPVTSPSLGTALPCGLAKPLLEQLTPMV